jgi:ligand-binding sensor domain-containing protein
MKKLLLTVLCVSLVIAEKEKTNFRHITVEKDGLSESSVYDIFQDSKGFMWFSTDNGLDKYDGYNIRQYQYLHDDTTSIGQGQSGTIFEDSRGNIWASTANGIVNKLNPETEKFKRLSVYKIHGAQLGGGLEKIKEDASGNIWCLDGNLIQINTKTDGRKYFYSKDSAYTQSFYNKVDALEKSGALVSGIKTPGNSVDSTHTFTLSKSKKVLIVSSGETVYDQSDGMGNPYDFGWLMNEKGETIWSLWKKGDKASAYAGGGYSHRIKGEELELPPGTYTLRWMSDALHSPEQWAFFIPPDSQHLWGINIYDVSKEKTPINLSKTLDNKELKTIINNFETNEDGTLWLAMGGTGLALFHPDSGIVERYIAEHSGSKDNPELSIIYNLIRDPFNKDYLWMTSPRGLHRFNTMTGKFKYFTTDYSGSKNVENNNPNRLEFLNENEIWVSKNTGGLARVNIKTGDISYLKNNKEDQKSITADGVSDLLKDNAGAMWVGTGTKGISIYDPFFEKFGHIRHAANTKNALSNPNVVEFVETKNGDVWIGTMGSIEKFEPKTGTLTNMNKAIGNDAGRINGLLVDGNKIYMGTSQQGVGAVLIAHNVETGENKRLAHDPKKTGSLTKNMGFFQDVFKDSRGILWMVGNQVVAARPPETENIISNDTNLDSILYSDKKTLEKIKQISTKLYGYGIRTIKEDKKGVLWAGGGGLFKINLESGETKYFSHDPNNPESLSNAMIVNMLVDSRGTLWVGTWGGGMCKLNQKTEKFKRYYKSEGGLPNSVVTGIIEDDEGYFWISTKGGMCRFNPIKETFESYYAQDGLQSNEFLTDAALLASDGTVYFGGGNGVTYFKPEKINKNPTPPSIAITSVKKDGVPEILGLNKTVPDQVSITYRDRGVSFDFTGLNFTRTEKNRYAYKMDGYDPDWISAQDRRFVSYTNLPPGDYTFQVKGSNNDGVWNEKGASIALIVFPPPWATWWAYTIYVSLLGLGVYGFVGYRERTHKREIEENRKSEELDLARQFQEDMLPKKMPDTPNFDIAAVIKTSTEVGGDYYDFFQQDDGSIYVVTGDATGHGMTAGMMVSITKAGLYGIPAIPTDQITNRLNRVIKNIELGTNRMALNVSYFKNGQVQFTSAGMPPAYHFISTTGEVKEILQVGLPLGGIQGERYSQEEHPFESGDTMVFLSDGLPEAENAAGEMLGYEAVMDCIEKNKNKNPETIKNILLDLGDNWLNGVPLQDDITIVVVKKRH